MASDMPVEINMSREDLASLVGTARENVVRLLSELKQQVRSLQEVLFSEMPFYRPLAHL